MITSGFYRIGPCGNFMRGGKWVYGPGYELHAELKDTYTYPVSDWRWFDSMEEAYAFFGKDLSEPCLGLTELLDQA